MGERSTENCSRKEAVKFSSAEFNVELRRYISFHNLHAQICFVPRKICSRSFCCEQRVTLVAWSQRHCVQCAIKDCDTLAVFFGETFLCRLTGGVKAIKISSFFVTKHRAERVENWRKSTPRFGKGGKEFRNTCRVHENILFNNSLVF